MTIDFAILSDRQVTSDTQLGEVFLAPLRAAGGLRRVPRLSRSTLSIWTSSVFSKKCSPYKYLHFGACDEDAKVYINGRHVFDHTLLTTGLLAQQIWLMPFVVPLDDVKLRGNDLMAVRTINTEGMGGVWKLVHLILSEQKLSKRQVSALIEVQTKQD